MIIPDQSHINRIRDALWQKPNGGASIMIGAGFSRNARKTTSGAREFPLWSEVSTLLCSNLYPSSEGERLKNAKTEASGTSGFLRLAQEYEAAFGRVRLHDFIKEVVPNDNYMPDDMHIRLLKLPWHDVFTTNWDTLLERTRHFVADQVYSVVRTIEEIPSTSKPRIIKLHGSFPANTPFIFTEEDYRTYPKKFAPFVNTVQQAMMETVLLLIGFSGDDPNFLHWSGWVRDNLGESAPKIYLAGWLDLSSHRRRMLEERNVIPIDLALHPQATHWPEHLRHRYASDWILHTLENGCPYEITDWPLPIELNGSSIPDFLQPVETVTINSPIKEPQAPFLSNQIDQDGLLEEVKAIVEIWKRNRNTYPGWLIIPPRKYHFFERSSRAWEKVIIHVLPKLSIIERLSVIREFVWRKEYNLEPLTIEIEEAIKEVLNKIDCQKREICGFKDNTLWWGDIRESWRNLALVLLTHARQSFDQVSFEKYINILEPFLGDHPDIIQRIYHEKCLWSLYALDFKVLDENLKAWNPESYDPIWMTRKSAILVETGRNDEAIRLINRCLSTIRESSRYSNNLSSLSREGWTLWLALAFESKFGGSENEVLDSPPVFRRWKQLASLDCDARSQKEDLLEALERRPEKKDGPLFDLGARKGKTIYFSNAKYQQWITARRSIRLCEVCGLPPSAAHMVIASDILALAADHLVQVDYVLASRLVLRLASSETDVTFNRIWSRSRIATMKMDEVNLLVCSVTSVIDYALPRAVRNGSNNSTFWLTRLRVAIEALSRLVLRLPPEHAENILKKGLKYYCMESIYKEHWLSNVIGNLLTRSWETLPKKSRGGYVLDLLSSPIAGLDGFDIVDERYPDTGALIVNDDETPVPIRTPETEGRWSQVVHMIVRGLRAGSEARERSAARLVALARWNLLTVSEEKLVAQALWQMEYIESDTLPSGTLLYDWAFLLLPEPEDKMAEKCFRKKWFGLSAFESKQTLNNFLWHVGNAFENLRNYRYPLVLTKEEHDNLVAITEKWMKESANFNDDEWVEFGIREGILGLRSVIMEIELPFSLAEELFVRVFQLNQKGIPAFQLFPGLAKAIPDRLNEIFMQMRIGLASNKVEVANNAILAAHFWLEVTSENMYLLLDLPLNILQEIGVVIATRRQGLLNRALQVARWIFSSGSPDQRAVIYPFTLHGLQYLIEELNYDRDCGEDEEVDVPLLRWGCAHLALSMLAAGYDSESTVKQWAEIAQNDPLPEVHHAETPVLISISHESLGR